MGAEELMPRGGDGEEGGAIARAAELVPRERGVAPPEAAVKSDPEAAGGAGDGQLQPQAYLEARALAEAAAGCCASCLRASIASASFRTS